ncbi:MAG: hypothetical protein ACRDB0_01675 [Paraclostridium sp.]
MTRFLIGFILGFVTGVVISVVLLTKYIESQGYALYKPDEDKWD